MDGDLAVSRALGDFQYKAVELDAANQKVSCVPDIEIVKRNPTDDILILACDGLWDVIKNRQAIASVRELFVEGEKDVKLIAEEMLDLCLIKGNMFLMK